jgi:hypothetical protein
VKKHLYLVCGGALAGLTMLHCSALAETAKPNSTAAAPASSPALPETRGQSSKTVVENCEDEWKANWEAMMSLDMTEDSYVQQCSVRDDAPAIPSEPKAKAAPPPALK